MPKFKWGIISTGNIARKFAITIGKMGDEAELHAVASRDLTKSKAFAEEYGAKKIYNSYEALAADPEIQAIYIGTPHSRHYEDIMLCLKHGKNVLCEKSFTVSAAQAREAFALAKEKGLFLMEAYWTRFIPAMKKICQLLEDGAIGDVELVSATYGFRNDARTERKFDPKLAGGALLDIGIYNIAFASLALGYERPEISTQVRFNEYGTDAASAIMLAYSNGRFAQISTAIQTTIPQQGIISGSGGYIMIDSVNGPQSVNLVQDGGETQVFDLPYEFTGFEYQIREVQGCVLAGKIQSELHPPEHTIAVMEIMDRVRELWGMKFPFEA